MHRIGVDQHDDELILEFPENDQLIFWPEVTEDDHYVAVSIVEGTESRNRFWLYPILDDHGRSRLGEPIKIVDEPLAEFWLVRIDGDTLFLRTDLDAERGRLVSLDLERFRRTGSAQWHEVLAESEHALVDAVGAGDGFVVTHLVDAQPRLIRLGRDGSQRGPIDVAGGALIGLDAHPGRDEVFVGLSSVTSPTQSFRVDFASGEVSALPELVLGADRTFTPPAIRVERRAATSVDGTQVPYFLIMPADG